MATLWRTPVMKKSSYAPCRVYIWDSRRSISNEINKSSSSAHHKTWPYQLVATSRVAWARCGLPNSCVEPILHERAAASAILYRHLSPSSTVFSFTFSLYPLSYLSSSLSSSRLCIRSILADVADKDAPKKARASCSQPASRTNRLQ